MEYHKDVERTFRKFFTGNVYIVNGSEIAKSLGNIQAANVVPIGALSNFFPELAVERWDGAIHALLPEKLCEINLQAFREGRAAIHLE